MSSPYIGEIRMFAGNFAPAGWAFCAGQLLPISEHEALFTLIGTSYGGDGESTFALPDLRGRIPIHQGQGAGLRSRLLAEAGGAETINLTLNQVPAHAHAAQVLNRTGSSPNPGSATWAASSSGEIYASGAPVTPTPMNSNAIIAVGDSQPHTNLQPYLCVSFIISLFGIFPSQT